MKKTLCLLMVALLMTVAFGASAEKVKLNTSASGFEVELTLPEGAVITSTQAVGDNTITVVSKEGVAPVRIVIAPSELYDNTQSLVDLSDEEKAELLQMVCEQYENPLSEIETTPSGNQHYMIDTNAESDLHIIFTLYKGYFFELTQWHEDYATLVEADMTFHHAIAEGLWVVAAE